MIQRLLSCRARLAQLYRHFTGKDHPNSPQQLLATFTAQAKAFHGSAWTCGDCWITRWVYIDPLTNKTIPQVFSGFPERDWYLRPKCGAVISAFEYAKRAGIKQMQFEWSFSNSLKPKDAQ